MRIVGLLLLMFILGYKYSLNTNALAYMQLQCTISSAQTRQTPSTIQDQTTDVMKWSGVG